MPDGVAHAADDSPVPLADGDLEPRLGRQPLEHADVGGRGAPRARRREMDAPPEARDRRIVGRTADLRMIDARQRPARVEEPRRERAVVREQQEPGRVHVEPADGIEPLAGAADERGHRRPPLGIRHRAHEASRLVQQDRPALARRREALTVHLDPVT